MSHRKLGEADFAMPLTGCGRAGLGSVTYTSSLSWLEPSGCGPALYINMLLSSPCAIRLMKRAFKITDGYGKRFFPIATGEAVL